jgi:hypothetical protein
MNPADPRYSDDDGPGSVLHGLIHATLLSLPIWGVLALAAWWILC